MTTPKKSLGQNFLMHAQTAERIVHAADVPSGMHVLEIGPGTGMLTRALLASGAIVTAVEADDELFKTLQETFACEIAEEKLTLVHDDIRAFDPSSLPVPYALVANIPYYITGEIIRSFLTAVAKPSSMTLLVQKEVAERIARSGSDAPGGKVAKESLLSLSVKAYGTPKYCFTVPRGAFFPAPNVDSAVISIRDIRKDSFSSPEEEEFFFSLIRAGFAHKRKLLMGNLRELFPHESLVDAFKAARIPEKTRAEDLTLENWLLLATFLRKKTA